MFGAIQMNNEINIFSATEKRAYFVLIKTENWGNKVFIFLMSMLYYKAVSI